MRWRNNNQIGPFVDINLSYRIKINLELEIREHNKLYWSFVKFGILMCNFFDILEILTWMSVNVKSSPRVKTLCILGIVVELWLFIVLYLFYSIVFISSTYPQEFENATLKFQRKFILISLDDEKEKCNYFHFRSKLRKVSVLFGAYLSELVNVKKTWIKKSWV